MYKMSYASSRTTDTRRLKSVDITSQIQDQSAITTLASGVLAPLLSINYPDGVWTGWAQISVKGDETTAFEYLNIIEDNENATTNTQESYFVNTTLPTGVNFYIKYPITKISFEDGENEVVLSAQAVFAGTAPVIQVTYLNLVKVV